MGSIHRSIPFFSDAITVIPHSVSTANMAMLDRPTTIAEFAAGEPVSLAQDLDSGEYVVTTRSGRFMAGPEASQAMPPIGYSIASDADYDAIEAGNPAAESWAFNTYRSGWIGGYPTRAAATAAAGEHFNAARKEHQA